MPRFVTYTWVPSTKRPGMGRWKKAIVVEGVRLVYGENLTITTNESRGNRQA